MIELSINGASHRVDAPADMPLLWVLRDLVGATGTKFGCGRGLCGACTVLADGEAIRSCQTPAEDVKGRKITTVEGAASSGVGRAVRASWQEIDVPQCGYCQPGQIMSAIALLSRNQSPSDAQIDDAMAGNVCRCGTYRRIRAAIHQAAKQTAKL